MKDAEAIMDVPMTNAQESTEAQPQRMITRGSSGAIRPRSVSDLLGERPSGSGSARKLSESGSRHHGQIVNGVQKSSSFALKRENVASLTSKDAKGNDLDILRWQSEVEVQPLFASVRSAHKIMTTSIWTSANEESRTLLALNRLDNLKREKLWSLRQVVKQKDPPRPKAHWDYVLSEAEWLSVDFSEERRWKLATAARLANAAVEWHNTEDKISICVKGLHHGKLHPEVFQEDRIMQEDDVAVNAPSSPQLGQLNALPDKTALPNGSDRIQFQSPLFAPTDFDSENSIYDLFTDNVVVSLDPKANDESNFLLQLPLYGPLSSDDSSYANIIDETPIAILSSYACTKPIAESDQQNDEDANDQIQPSNRTAPQLFAMADPVLALARHRKLSSVVSTRPPLPPMDLENKIHVPWSREEDEFLLALVKQCNYNWDLVASEMSDSYHNVSCIESRSSWECFERWYLLDGEAPNVNLTGSHSRYALAKVEESVKKIRNGTAEANITPAVREFIKRNQPRMDIRRHRYLGVFEAIKKVVRKREAAPKTQGHLLSCIVITN